MKKSLLICFIAMIIIAGCAPKKSKNITMLCWGTQYNDYPEFLNGKVKEIKQNTYWAVEKSGQVEKGALLTLKEVQDSGILSGFYALYNDSGILLRHDYLGDNSKVQWSHVNEIKNGRVSKENWVRNDSIIGYSIFNYNDQGFIDNIPMHDALADSSNGKLVITSDGKGNMTQMKVLNSKDVFTNRIEYTWNEAGRMIQLENFQANDTLVYKLVFTFNDHGFWDTIKTFDKKGKMLFDASGTYTYDEKGNWIRAVWSKAGKPWEIFDRSYVYY